MVSSLCLGGRFLPGPAPFSKQAVALAWAPDPETIISVSEADMAHAPLALSFPEPPAKHAFSQGASSHLFHKDVSSIFSVLAKALYQEVVTENVSREKTDGTLRVGSSQEGVYDKVIIHKGVLVREAQGTLQ